MEQIEAQKQGLPIFNVEDCKPLQLEHDEQALPAIEMSAPVSVETDAAPIVTYPRLVESLDDGNAA